jgi:hypothetical protein
MVSLETNLGIANVHDFGFSSIITKLIKDWFNFDVDHKNKPQR